MIDCAVCEIFWAEIEDGPNPKLRVKWAEHIRAVHERWTTVAKILMALSAAELILENTRDGLHG